MIGWRPCDFWAATLAEHSAAVAGWNRAHGHDPDKSAPAGVDFDDLARMKQQCALERAAQAGADHGE